MCETKTLKSLLYSLLFWRWQTSEVLLVRLAAIQPPPWSLVCSQPMQLPDLQPVSMSTEAKYICTLFSFSYETKCMFKASMCSGRVWEKDLMWLEVDIAQMKDRGQHSVDALLLLWSKTQDVHGIQQTSEIFPIILSLYGTISSLHTYTLLWKTILCL